jgi:hypothetical protein
LYLHNVSSHNTKVLPLLEYIPSMPYIHTSVFGKLESKEGSESKMVTIYIYINHSRSYLKCYLLPSTKPHTQTIKLNQYERKLGGLRCLEACHKWERRYHIIFVTSFHAGMEWPESAVEGGG